MAHAATTKVTPSFLQRGQNAGYVMSAPFQRAIHHLKRDNQSFPIPKQANSSNVLRQRRDRYDDVQFGGRWKLRQQSQHKKDQDFISSDNQQNASAPLS